METRGKTKIDRGPGINEFRISVNVSISVTDMPANHAKTVMKYLEDSASPALHSQMRMQLDAALGQVLKEVHASGNDEVNLWKNY